MSERSAARVGVTVGLASIAFAVAGLVLVHPYWHVPHVGLSQQAASAFIGVTFASVGAFLAWKAVFLQNTLPMALISGAFLTAGLVMTCLGWRKFESVQLVSSTSVGAIALRITKVGRDRQRFDDFVDTLRQQILAAREAPNTADSCAPT